jgi:thymidylate kinase
MMDNILIIEGIPGSGKTTLINNLKKDTSRNIYAFDEDLTMSSWKHYTDFNFERMSKVRMPVMESLLNQAQNIIKKDKNALFIFGRFHITYQLYTPPKTKGLKQRYDNLINNLKSQKTKILIPHLNHNNIDKRSTHHERKDPIWVDFIEKLPNHFGYISKEDMFIDEQKKIYNILKKQKIPYEFISINYK